MDKKQRVDVDQDNRAQSGAGSRNEKPQNELDEGHHDAKPAGDEADAKDRPKKPLSPAAKVAILAAILAVAIAAVGYGFHWWVRGSYYQSSNDAYLQADQVNIAPRVTGYVEEIFVKDNQEVAAGEPLIRISGRDYQARVEQDRSQIAEAQADVLEVIAQMKQQEAQIAQNEAQLGQSEAQQRQYAASTQFNDAEARRYRPLAASGAETNEKLANYVNSARQSRAQVEGARAQAAADTAKIEYARRQIDIYRAQLLGTQAKIERAQAQMAQDQVDLDGVTLVSSIAGRVGDRTVRVGQYLQSGTRVMTIVPVNSLYLKANFKETQIGLMRVGQPASITVDALSSMVLHGTVESFSPGTGAQFSLIPSDNATGNFTKITQRVPVRIQVSAGPEARRVLVPGMSVTVEVDTISAKADLDAQARESEAQHDQRQADDKQQNDRQSHNLGAGRE